MYLPREYKGSVKEYLDMTSPGFQGVQCLAAFVTATMQSRFYSYSPWLNESVCREGCQGSVKEYLDMTSPDFRMYNFWPTSPVRQCNLFLPVIRLHSMDVYAESAVRPV